MDTFTQGLLGAAAAQAVFAKQLPRAAGVIGFVAAVVPDLDLFLGSSTDPVATWLCHRQFTHSLLFIPIGAWLCSLLCIWMKTFKGVRLQLYGAALVGYATHAPLDALTSYGTVLLWPFSDRRVAWDVIGIIDPIFTVALLLGVIGATVVRRAGPSRLALAVAVAYLGFGVWQHQRAVDVQRQLAQARGHAIGYSRVMPAPGSLVLWRSVYVTDGRIHVDGVRVPWWDEPLVKPGGSVRLATFSDVPPAMAERDGTRRMFEVFSWFADGLVAPVDGEPYTIGDLRYAVEWSGLTPLWGIQFDPQRSPTPRRWRPQQQSRGDYMRKLWRTLIDGDPGYRPVGEVLPALSRG
ncbi:MAG TPA: metal-dependent hydrolase [Alphaproteobacteria bacterium]|nr:metal-dependent hydrolase [Alphaproteobacteria bacterium]